MYTSIIRMLAQTPPEEMQDYSHKQFFLFEGRWNTTVPLHQISQHRAIMNEFSRCNVEERSASTPRVHPLNILARRLSPLLQADRVFPGQH